MANKHEVTEGSSKPDNCPQCRSSDTEEVETETTMSGDFIRRFACNQCYAGFEVYYTVSSIETYHDPEVSP